MNLIEFASDPALDRDSKLTIELLIDRMASRLDDYDYNAASQRQASRTKDNCVPLVDLAMLERVYPLLVETKWLNLQNSKPKLKSLTPIQFLTNLETLIVSDNAIQDLSPLMHLEKLRSLHLTCNPVERIDVLSHIKSIRELQLLEVPIKDLSPLAKLPQLEELAISTPLIGAFDKRDQYPALKYLGLTGWEALPVPLDDLPELPSLLEISGLETATLGGIERFSSLVNLTNLSGEFDDVAPVGRLQRLTHLNILNCQVADLAPLARHPSLVDIRISSDRITRVDALMDLPKACEIHVSGQAIKEPARKKLQSVSRSWDEEFLTLQPIAEPDSRVKIVTKAEFDRYDVHESYGLNGWNGNRLMLSSEADWLETKMSSRLDAFLDEEEDYYLPSRVRYARSTTLVLYTEKAVTQIGRVVNEIQQALCCAKNPWIVYFQSDMFESGSEWPNFVSWIYPDHIMAQQEDADRIRRHLES